MEKKLITLSNKIEVLIISDPTLNKSSFALDIAVGSLDDPKDKQGLAHLIEHMFFMGTKKYPKKNEFHEFLASNQGSFNASTGLEHTNYRFEIDHGALENALDRFSQFFISPSFNVKYIEAEKKVINAEFSKNKTDQTLREQRLFYSTCVEKHPITQFHHGSQETFKKSSKKDLEQFFNNKYSANLMKIVLLSKFEISELERYVTLFFSPVVNNNFSKTDYKAPVFDQKTLPSLIEYNSQTSDQTLKLCFETFSLYEHYKTKPNWIFNFLLNATRNGSLSQSLKKEGLITELWASTNTLSFTGFIYIDFKLTQKGAAKIYKIIEQFFAYINTIKKAGYPKYIFEEQKSISTIGFKFKERAEGFNVVKNLAKNMHYYPALMVEECNDVLTDYDADIFDRFLSCITPDKMKAFMSSSKSSGGSSRKFGKKEKYFGIQYGVKKINLEKINKLDTVDSDLFKYPEPNIFIPQNFELYNDDPNPLPHKILDDERGFVWFIQDNAQGLPLAYINLLILTNTVNRDARAKLLSLFYTRLVESSIGDVADMAGEAGFSFGIDRDDRGISLYFVGYADKVIELGKTIIGGLTNRDWNADTFNEVKMSIVNDCSNLLNGSSYDLAQYRKYNLIHKHNIYFDDYVGLLQKVNLDDVKRFSEEVFVDIALESYCYGSISPKDILGFYDVVFKSCNSNILYKKGQPEDHIILYPAGQPLACVIKSKSKDDCWSTFIEFGERTLHLSAVMQLGYVFLEPFFFDYLRNKKQIGYVVETRLDFFKNVLGLSFNVLSEEYSADKIAIEAEKALDGFIKYLHKISEKDLDNSKRALINKIKKKNRTLEEWMSEIVLTAALKGDNQYAEKLSQEIENLSLEELVSVFKKALLKKNRSSLSVYVSSRKNIKISRDEEIIKDIKEFKNKSRFV